MDDRDKKNEMEQIQRGLEAFLNSELKGTGAEVHDSKEEGILRDEKGIQQRAQGIIRNTGNGYFEEEGFEGGYSGEKRGIKVIHFGQEASGGFRRDGREEADTETEAVDWDLAGRKSGAAPRQAAGRGVSGMAERQKAGVIPPRKVQQAHGNLAGGRRRTADAMAPQRVQQPCDPLSDRPLPQGRLPNVRQLQEDSAPGRPYTGYPEEAAGPQGRPPGKKDRKESRSGRKASGEPGEKDGAMEKTKSKKKKSEKKKSRLKSALCKLLVASALIISLLGFGLYQLVGLAYGKMTFREIVSLADLPMKEDGVVNILLIGNDSRQNGEDGRSDAMILLSISNRTKTIYMTSLLRDMYVEIPGYDGNRLNAAYSFGGAELLMETIKENFGIPVNRYISVNFEAFANLVDAVGGIELELTSEEIEYVNGYLVEYNMLTNRPQGTDNMDTSVSGLVHLNGPQALAYSRNRYLGTDFGRTERQRKVLTAVIGKAPGALLTNAGGLLDGLMPNLTTNLTQQECFRLSLMAGKLLTYDIISDSLPQPGTYQNVYIRDMAVLQVDFDANVRYLKEKIYGE